MRRTLNLAGTHARAFACVLTVAGALVIFGCQSAPSAQTTAGARPAVLVMENLGPCAWEITAVPTGQAARHVAVPVGETVRLELPAGACEITQEALAGLDTADASRQFAMSLVAGETYHWRLVTLATVRHAATP